MTMKKELHNIFKSLASRDIEALRSIYDHRCLTTSQIYEAHYMESQKTGAVVSDDYCRKKVREFLQGGIIRKEDYLGNEVYFLTSDGIDIVRHAYNLPVNIYDHDRRVVRRGYYTAKELEVFPKYINHQINLNQFVLDFKKVDIPVPWKYYDEKHVSQYSGIRPDGLISMLDIDFFLEMDMSTESKKQLFDKWDNYRNFLASREYAFKERRIVVLFIVENSTRSLNQDEERLKEKIKNRISLVRYTIFERLLDQMSPDFEIYVGSKDEIVSLIKEKIIPSATASYPYVDKIKNALVDKHGFSIDSGESFKKSLSGAEFAFYVRKTNNGNVEVSEGRVNEFLLDEYSYSPVSILNKIAYLRKYNIFFRSRYKREIRYIVVVPNVRTLHSDLKLMDLLCTENVFFTTATRLSEMPFHQALFQFDFFGNVYSFSNTALTKRVFEGTID